MKWSNRGSSIELNLPHPFSFDECLRFLARSGQEVLHEVGEGEVVKLLKVEGELVLCRVTSTGEALNVAFLNTSPSQCARELVADYMVEWFDLEQDLSGFMEMAGRDPVLKPFAERYEGMRILCIPDLFEALVWAILGQQINLTFAYTLKKRFVERYGESVTFNGSTHWLFPSCERVATLSIDELRELQLTRRKAEYVLDLAKAMERGELSKEALLQLDASAIRENLLAIRGVGAWTADYVRMKCFHDRSAFPVADVGLHLALKEALGLERKPTIEEIEELAINWKGWEAYATFYLWRSLYGEGV
ncbi:DNA-3-methyladenine glycosylase family protein [Rossellomorea marisflavi]|uniref:DNA-3-methyladenine glycosylase family protein n=1 Tax=Rossellomorea marisflavi TaxID=189381 RepID=UPI00064FE069|nr:DNA-3-methyladenine glycosylase 2 [Rossellomorea marisflavi]KML33248.1 DNA-3-methyladenine glycosylase [Rossellomorea marisflavi]